MANPRQRRKAKSSSHQAVSHSKRAKRLQKKMPAIRGPKALQDAWDRSKTLRQKWVYFPDRLTNYVALGLQHDLNPISSGGSEVSLVHATDHIDASQPQAIISSSRVDETHSSVSGGLGTTPALPKGFGRIIRDPSGTVLCVELPNDEDVDCAPTRGPMIDFPVATIESELRVWADDRPRKWQGSGKENMQDAVVQDLEKLAASAIAHQRYTSSGERLYLERLVNKYGNDADKMARDRRLNPEQRTANELRRAIAKAGGIGALCESTAGAVTVTE